MPTYKVTDPTTGKSITLTGDSPPTEQELTQVFSQLQRGAPPQSGPPTGMDMLKQGVGSIVDAGKDVLSRTGQMITDHPAQAGAMALGVPMSLLTGGLGAPAAMGLVGLASAGGAGAGLAASQVANRDTQPLPSAGGNIGAMAEQAAIGAGSEGAGRVLHAAADAIPNVARAGQKFEQVMSVAKNVPVDINAPGQAALDTMQLAERGGTMPTPVNKFIRYITDPNKGQFTYAEARDFASNISRLSSNDYQKMTPVMARSVADLRVTLNKAVADAAQSAGQGAEYRAAMTEYARAMKLRDAVSAVVEGAKKGVPIASAGATGYWLTSRIRSLLGE